MNRYLAGAVGGFAATVPMTVTMLGLHRRLPPDQRYKLPPREVTLEIARRSGSWHRPLSDSQRRWVSLAAHFAYGAATGALYAPIARRTRHVVVPGAAYGVGVWAASYLGWIPALKILRPASRHPPQRRRLMIAAHLVWGAATALTLNYLTAPRRR